jgi:hypothetical protein
MALRIPYGLDPDETWEIDFAEASAQRAVEEIGEKAAALKVAAEAEKDEAKRATLLAGVKAAEETKAKLEGELAAYVRGAGTIFIVGPLPNGKRAELLGESYEVTKIAPGKDHSVRDTSWSEEVVRWTVRGHRNFKSGKSGKDLPFHTETADFAGEKRTVVGRKTLEAYGRFIGELALVALRSQRLDEAGKNA